MPLIVIRQNPIYFADLKYIGPIPWYNISLSKLIVNFGKKITNQSIIQLSWTRQLYR